MTPWPIKAFFNLIDSIPLAIYVNSTVGKNATDVLADIPNSSLKQSIFWKLGDSKWEMVVVFSGAVMVL